MRVPSVPLGVPNWPSSALAEINRPNASDTAMVLINAGNLFEHDTAHLPSHSRKVDSKASQIMKWEEIDNQGNRSAENQGSETTDYDFRW